MLSALHRLILTQRPVSPFVDALSPLVASAGRRAVSQGANAGCRGGKAGAAQMLLTRSMSASTSAAGVPKNYFETSQVVVMGSAFAAAAMAFTAWESASDIVCGPHRTPARAEGKLVIGAEGTKKDNLESDWDEFMIRSIKPVEDDDDEEDYDDEEDDEEEEDEEERLEKQGQGEDAASEGVLDLANVPSPSAAQEEYVLEYELSVSPENCTLERHFWSTEHESANSNVLLEEWYNYIGSRSCSLPDVDDDDDDEEDDEDEEEEEETEELPEVPAVVGAVRVLMHDAASGNTAQMAYVRDQNGKLIGIRHFEDDSNRAFGDPDETKLLNFRIVPGRLGFVRVFVIYEGATGTKANCHARRLVYSPPIPIPSVPRKFDADEDDGDDNWVPCA